MMATVVVYVVAGLFGYYLTPQDERWQRLLLIPFWGLMFLYSLLVDFTDWWRERGYHYESDEEEPEPPSDHWVEW